MKANDTCKGVTIRQSGPGDAGYVDYLHMRLYQNVYQFKPIFEHYVMKGLSEFLLHSNGSMLWVAEDGSEIIGSIAIVKTDDHTAQLRWFLLDERYQGLGIGKRLMAQAMSFCCEHHYQSVYLWTIDFLHAARHIYERSGFTLVETKCNNEWTDHVITEELWELKQSE